MVAIWAHEDPVIVTLTIEGETIETTPEHPFYTDEGEWLPSASLQAGDEIRTSDWGTGTVEAIQFSDQPQLMYNFTVATAHTYFVGNKQWLVHNDCFFDFKTANDLLDHFGDHGFDMAYDTIDDYLQGANDLILDGINEVTGIKTFYRANGDQLFFDTAKGHFAVLNADGSIGTFFRPDYPWEYWLEQINQ